MPQGKNTTSEYLAGLVKVAILQFQDLLNVWMKGGDLRAILNGWGLAVVGQPQVPEDDIHSGLQEHLSYYARLPVGHPEKD